MRGALAATLLFFTLPSMAAQTPPAPGSEAPFTNRLIDSDAPYLLLHAHNPVDWYPWGPEAFAQAKGSGRNKVCNNEGVEAPRQQGARMEQYP